MPVHRGPGVGTVKTFPGSDHRGLIAGYATEATARALYAGVARYASTGCEDTAPGGLGPMAMGHWPGHTGFCWTESAGLHTLFTLAEHAGFGLLVHLK
jgi:hypothetical protein